MTKSERDEAIRVIKSECYIFNMLNLDRTTIVNSALDKAVEALKQTRWIPVSERLPRDGQKVLCQCQAEIIDVFVWSKSIGWIENDRNAYMPLFVIAWMPLPEPYKTESEEEDE